MPYADRLRDAIADERLTHVVPLGAPRFDFVKFSPCKKSRHGERLNTRQFEVAKRKREAKRKTLYTSEGFLSSAPSSALSSSVVSGIQSQYVLRTSSSTASESARITLSSASATDA